MVPSRLSSPSGASPTHNAEYTSVVAFRRALWGLLAVEPAQPGESSGPLSWTDQISAVDLVSAANATVNPL